MTSPNVFDVFALFLTTAPRAFFETICRNRDVPIGSGIYSLPVVSWLMILQRLQWHQTLEATVQWLCHSRARSLLNDCKRVREGRISPQRGRFLPSAGQCA
jgi:hypothetical protein